MPLEIFPLSIESIEKAVLKWIELLEQEKYIEAYELTLHDVYYQWSPASIESVINGYGLPYESANEKYKVTPTVTATGEHNLNPYKEIHFFNDPLKHVQRLPNMQAIGYICYDLPINGEWSDLSATFTIYKSSGFFILELNEIHVF